MRIEQRLWRFPLVGFICVASVHAQAVLPVGEPPLCEYVSQIEVSPETGEIGVSRQKISKSECAEFGAAVAEMPNAWRRRLPPRVRWEQRADATELCQRPQTELGQRLASQLAPHGCVFLKSQEVCTIVSGAALSHAQLANAVRECAP